MLPKLLIVSTIGFCCCPFTRWEFEACRFNGFKATCQLGLSEFVWWTPFQPPLQLQVEFPRSLSLDLCPSLSTLGGFRKQWVPVKLRCLPMTRWRSKRIVLVSRPRPAVTLASTLEIFPAGQHRTMWTLMQRSQPILLLDRSHYRQLASSWTALRYQECNVMSTWASLLHLICAGMTMLPLYWRKLRLHYTCLLPSPIVINQLPPAVIWKFYVAFIRPRMEYCNAVWCGTLARSLKSLEKARLKVARAIVHSQRGQPGLEVLSEGNLPTLVWRRRVHCLHLLYILYEGQGPPSLSELLPATVQARTEIVLRSSHSFRFPFASSSRHLSPFLCFSIRLWNTLPASAISQSRSVSSFRFFLHSFYKADKFSIGL